MSLDITGIVNLDYIVNRVLMDLDDYSNTKYLKFLQYAIDGYTDLQLYTMQNVKVAYLPVNDNKTVDLPNDFIEYTKIGYDAGGVFRTLGHNEDLMLPRATDDCGNVTNDNADVCATEELIIPGGVFPGSGFYWSPHYRNGQYVGELYSGAGDEHIDGRYRLDRDRGQIAFNSAMDADTIILEYKSSGVNGDGSTNIPRQCAPALIAYVHWQRREYNDKVAGGEKMRLQQRYIVEYEKLRDLEFSFTYSEYISSRREGYNSIPKR